VRYLSIADLEAVLKKCRDENLDDRALRKLLRALPTYQEPPDDRRGSEQGVQGS